MCIDSNFYIKLVASNCSIVLHAIYMLDLHNIHTGIHD